MSFLKPKTTRSEEERKGLKVDLIKTKKDFLKIILKKIKLELRLVTKVENKHLFVESGRKNL